MSELFLLSERQMARISPHFPRSHGRPRVDDRRVISGIIYVIRNGLRWKDAPQAYGPHKTLYNRFVRWSRRGVFERIFAELAGEGPSPNWIMIDATHLKAHRLGQAHYPAADRGPDERSYRRSHVAREAAKRQYFDLLIGDRGYDSDDFRTALNARGIKVCIPPTKNRKQPIDYDKALYKWRHKIENMFGRLKDWRRIAMRYDRCAHTFFSAICLAAIVLFYL